MFNFQKTEVDSLCSISFLLPVDQYLLTQSILRAELGSVFPYRSRQ